jgi:oligopeptide transport system ATP-binding protein
MDKDNKKLLEVKNLKVSFFTPAGEVKAVNDISYELEPGEVMGIVGESGSGKSVEAYTIIGLLASPGKVMGGEIIFDGENLLEYSEEDLRKLRGDKISMIFQNPMTCLNPVYTIGNQLVETFAVHTEIPKDEAWQKATDMLSFVGINNPDKRMNQYPHELSGGMRQRVMIAMALLCNPKLLIADEPTTALDVTIQAQILDLMKDIIRKTEMSTIFITHNLAVVAEICDKVSVMYAGKLVETGNVDEIFYNPSHPYTLGLLKSMPRVDETEHERLVPIEGSPVDMLNPPEGCGFGARCEHCMNICLRKDPPLIDLGNGHKAKCWLLAMKEYEGEDK